MKRIVLLIIATLFSLTAFSQLGKKKYADKLYNEFSFIKAVEVYNEMYQKKPDNFHINERLANCYMFLRQPENALKHYKNVVRKSANPKYYLAYAQALRGAGEYKKSEKWMRKFKNIGGKDTRANQFFDNPDFFDLIYNKEKRYALKNHPANTYNSDYGAIKYNGETYFVSARNDEDASTKRVYNWNNQPFLDIFKLNDSSSVAIRLPESINTKFHEGAACFTPNGKYMYFTRNNYHNKKAIKDSEGTNNLKIFRAELINNEWVNSRPLFFSSDEYSVGHPSISSDGKYFFFTSDMPGGYGGTDIYVCEVHERGGLKKPMNLGPIINTEGNEMFPFFHQKENRLYFSSDGHLGLGQLDIFTAELKDNTYSNVTNLGEPVNSIADDFAYNLNELGNEGFLSSNREGGVGDDDIYTFTRRRDFTLKGRITDKITKEPLEGATIILSDSDGNILHEVVTAEDGYYEKLIKRNHNYQINGDKPKFENDFKAFNSFNQEEYTEMIVNLELDPLRDMNILAGLSADIIYFDFDKWDIREDAKPELNKIIAVMNKYKNMVIHIESHTDSRGSAAYNEKLSSKRAESTYNYFIEQGIETSRITSHKGYGEYQLTNDCGDGKKCNEDQHQANRRTEFVIEKMN
ncbi:OmpA family protein [Pseudofulvibacter geojedonensis]|uniref:OmpA family protein n=1 Tax=Pseudofulvibacter geojedonensis TaxID=1123758 RepID=A0ABW3HY75_9FLAO